MDLATSDTSGRTRANMRKHTSGLGVDDSPAYAYTSHISIDVQLRNDRNHIFCCQPRMMGRRSVKLNSGHLALTKCNCVSSEACEQSVRTRSSCPLPGHASAWSRLTCHIIKSLRRLTFDVRTRMSSLPAVFSSQLEPLCRSWIDCDVPRLS